MGRGGRFARGFMVGFMTLLDVYREIPDEIQVVAIGWAFGRARAAFGWARRWWRGRSSDGDDAE